MIINYSILLYDSWFIKETIGVSANKDKFNECLNITKCETSWTAWFARTIEIGMLTRYSVVVF